MTNDLWAITFGDYDFSIDRKKLTYSLTETKTGTIWAENLSVGWIKLEKKDHFLISKHSSRKGGVPKGNILRLNFGEMNLVSLSEKSGMQGKRILFGLRIKGIPVDVYFTCAQREIQLTVEANRDSEKYRVVGFGLLPGLCRAAGDNADVDSCLLPTSGRYIFTPQDVADHFSETALGRTKASYPVWDSVYGTTMPFLGAVRGADDNEKRVALAILHDSAYADVTISQPQQAIYADIRFGNDPERRRLDLRILPLPGGDAVSVARIYRDKLVNDRQHIPLRRKMREQPALENLVGAALIEFGIQGNAATNFADAVAVARDLQENGMDRACCLFMGWGSGESRDLLPACPDAGGDDALITALRQIREMRFLSGIAGARRSEFAEIREKFAPDALFLRGIASLPLANTPSRWEAMDDRLALIAEVREHFPLFGSDGGADWSAIACDFWTAEFSHAQSGRTDGGSAIPYATVYHDSVIAYPDRDLPLHPDFPERFLCALLLLSPPAYRLAHADYFADAALREYIQTTYAVLSPLHRLSFPAFLTNHLYLGDSKTVEEVRYSNGMRVVVNWSRTETYTDDLLTLPPLGFYAEQGQRTAHDALRVGAEEFAARGMRVALTNV